MLLNFILLVSALVYSEARSRPSLEVFEIRENRKDLEFRPIYGHENQGKSELAKLLSAVKNRLKSYDSESSDDGGNEIIFLNGHGDSSLPLWHGTNDEFVDKTRSIQLVKKKPHSIRGILYGLFPEITKKNRALKSRRPKILRSQTMVDDRTAAPRHRYRYDYE